MVGKLRDAAKERRWRAVLKRFARSGLGVRGFCRREGLAESAFYFWRRELARRDGEKQSRDGEELSRDTAPRPRILGHVVGRSDFLPVRVTDAFPRHASITLELAGGRVLRLPDAMPARQIAELVLAIETTDVEVDRSAAEVGQ